MKKEQKRAMYIRNREHALKYKRDKYAKRKAMNLCIVCGSPKLASASKVLCQFHLDSRLEHCKNYRQRLKEFIHVRH